MNAERLLAHYERIADAPDAIARLRRFILDLAVRGKLLPQDSNDEPASELLKRIAKEKARLVKAVGIRTPKAIPALSETPFPIPSSSSRDAGINWTVWGLRQDRESPFRSGSVVSAMPRIAALRVWPTDLSTRSTARRVPTLPPRPRNPGAGGG